MLRASIPKSSKYPKELKALGDHIRKRRLDLGLFQKQVAQQIGVSEATVWNWESNATEPRVTDMPRVIEFLGYNPMPEPQTLGEKLLSARKTLGITQKEMARRLGIDPATLGRLERDTGRRPFAETLRQVQLLVGN